MTGNLRDVPVNKLTVPEVLTELANLAKEIAIHNIAYFQEDDPKINDAAYDALKQRNSAIEAKFPDHIRADSPSNQIGAPLLGGFPKVIHSQPMLSLKQCIQRS